MSSFTKPLVTKYLGRGMRELTRNFIYHIGEKNSGKEIFIPNGFKTDFASIPWPASMLIPKDGDYNQPTVLHDFLYSKCGEIPQRDSLDIIVYSRKECDDIFLESMVVIDSLKEFSIPFWKRRTMYRAVRLFGGFAWGSKRGS